MCNLYDQKIKKNNRQFENFSHIEIMQCRVKVLYMKGFKVFNFLNFQLERYRHNTHFQ